MHLRATIACIAVLIALAEPAIGQQGEANRQAAAPRGGEVAIALTPDGSMTASGMLPGLTREALSAALPGIELSRMGQAEGGSTGDWQPALDALSIVVPRFRSASVSLAPGALAIQGTLRSGLSASGAHAALRAALGTDWRLRLELTETPPAAEIVVTKSDAGTVVSGLLPSGIAPREAVERLGPDTSDNGLAGGGEGDAEAWSEALAALGQTIELLVAGQARISAQRVTVGGSLRPGYPRLAVSERLAGQLPPGWTAELAAGESPASEGDRRVSLETGKPESFRRGFWLPDVSFPVSVARCRAESDAALAGAGLPFMDGTALIEARGLALLNRLAAVAVRCLNSSSLQLEIGGHTDSVGNDAKNAELSQARAVAVRKALVDRGVRAEAITAHGYGESDPLASNNTPDGRAQNQRLTFDWSGSDG